VVRKARKDKTEASKAGNKVFSKDNKAKTAKAAEANKNYRNAQFAV